MPDYSSFEKDGFDRYRGAKSFNVSDKVRRGTYYLSQNGILHGCSITKVDQPKGRKPHYILASPDGETLIEVSAVNHSPYEALKSYAGTTGNTVSWQLRGNRQYGYYMHMTIQSGSRDMSKALPRIPRIIIDTETTGINDQYNELLQISIIDGSGNQLWNRYYKPEHITSWPEAEAVNHITPQMVADKPHARDDKDELQALIDRADEVCAYNAGFDLSYLADIGIRGDGDKVTDTQHEYAEYLGDGYHDYPRLTDAAASIGYAYDPHDSLSDCKATLAVQNAIDRAKNGTPASQIVVTPSVALPTTRPSTTMPAFGIREKPSMPSADAWHSAIWLLMVIFLILGVILCLIPATEEAGGTLVLIAIIYFIYRHHKKKKGNTK